MSETNDSKVYIAGDFAGSVPAAYRIVAVLRRAPLDARDAAIVRCVAESATSPSFRELMEAGGMRSIHTVAYRIGNYMYKDKSLKAEGWLRSDGPGRARALTLGPRFGGLDRDGWPMERVG